MTLHITIEFSNLINQSIFGTTSIQECRNWCVQEHFIINFWHIKFLTTALIILLITNYVIEYKDFLYEKVPSLIWLWGMIIRQGAMTSALLIMAFLVWNLHALGKINLPFLN